MGNMFDEGRMWDVTQGCSVTVCTQPRQPMAYHFTFLRQGYPSGYTSEVEMVLLHENAQLEPIKAQYHENQETQRRTVDRMWLLAVLCGIMSSTLSSNGAASIKYPSFRLGSAYSSMNYSTQEHLLHQAGISVLTHLTPSSTCPYHASNERSHKG